jgi:hypothetical protein
LQFPFSTTPEQYNDIFSRMDRAYIDSASIATDNSELWDSEVQLRYTISNTEVVGGFQYRYYNPKASFLSGPDNPAAVSFGAARDITATEIGGYLQLDRRFLIINFAQRSPLATISTPTTMHNSARKLPLCIRLCLTKTFALVLIAPSKCLSFLKIISFCLADWHVAMWAALR